MTALANVLQRAADVPFHIGHRFASALVTHGRAEGLTPEQVDLTTARRLYQEVTAQFNGVPEQLPLTGSSKLIGVQAAAGSSRGCAACA